MNNYWDVGQFFTVSMLANDIPKATQAAEKLFKLKPPLWYTKTVYLLHSHCEKKCICFAHKCVEKRLFVFGRSSPSGTCDPWCRICT